MKKSYIQLELIFEKITSFITLILGKAITFIVALLLVLFWIFNRKFSESTANDNIRDIIQGVAFLCLFVIQKSFNRFTASLHVKLNELVSSHETANNAVINVETKTEFEIVEMQKQYVEALEKELDE